MSKPKAAKEDPSTIAMRERQVADLSRLDEEENMRIKQLLIGQRGGRFFRGSPAARALPANRAGITAPAAAGGNLYTGGSSGAQPSLPSAPSYGRGGRVAER